MYYYSNNRVIPLGKRNSLPTAGTDSWIGSGIPIKREYLERQTNNNLFLGEGSEGYHPTPPADWSNRRVAAYSAGPYAAQAQPLQATPHYSHHRPEQEKIQATAPLPIRNVYAGESSSS